jgi:hypothetical protein
MHPNRRFPRRGLHLIGVVVLLGLVAPRPWDLAAQDAAQKNAVSNNNGKMQTETAGPSSDQKSSNAKLLVGAWRGGRDSEEKSVVFNQDGTYEDLGANLFCEEHDISESGRGFKEQAFVRSQGNWQVKDGRLVLTNNDRTAFWDQAPSKNSDPAKSTCRYDILRSDDGFLRLRLVPNQTTQRSTFFFHRTKETPIEKEFANVPPEYRRVLAAAELTPDEAAAFADWLKTQKLDSPAQLEVIDRLMQARRHKITLAQLFGMTTEEAAAFREVVGQANGDYERLARLAASDELTGTERQAIGKVTSVITDLNRLTEQLPMDMQSRIAVRGRGGMEVAQQMAQEAMNRDFTNSANFGGGFGGQAAGGFGNANAVAAAAQAGGGRGGRAATTTRRVFRGGGRGTVLAPNAETLDETQREAVVKLNVYLADLGQWFWRTVFPVD